MSCVTDVLLTHDIMEDGGLDGAVCEPVAKLNALLEHRGEFVRLDPHAGGRKVMQGCVCGIAFNYFDIWELAHLILAVQWRHPENVQCFVQREHEAKFRLFDWGNLTAIVESEDPRKR